MNKLPILSGAAGLCITFSTQNVESASINPPRMHTITGNSFWRKACFITAVPCRAVLPEAASAPVEEIFSACREAVSFAQALSAGRVATPSADLLELADQAAISQRSRENENVQAWADKLANEVGNVID